MLLGCHFHVQNMHTNYETTNDAYHCSVSSSVSQSAQSTVLDIGPIPSNEPSGEVWIWIALFSFWERMRQTSYVSFQFFFGSGLELEDTTAGAQQFKTILLDNCAASSSKPFDT